MRLKPKLVLDVYRNRPAFSFYRDIAFSDCQILPENPLCKAHQNVLAGASTWLRKHFRKKKEISLYFKNYDGSTMEAAIKLMYTRKVDPNLDIKTMMNLLKFADDFKLKDKDLIERWLECNLTLENACQILAVSSSDDIEDPKSFILNVILLLSANIDKLTDVDGFKLLSARNIHEIMICRNEIALLEEKINSLL
uniref:BTB domain-containing protein n=1 Tax=Panagrolaimus sp. JU765 TaxID=591449 RepID=A0AC34PWZ8_9BILA